jgi:hypothetical protein
MEDIKDFRVSIKIKNLIEYKEQIEKLQVLIGEINKEIDKINNFKFDAEIQMI